VLDHLQRCGPLPHRHLAETIFHCALALDFLHSELRLMHTDLKPENLLLESAKTAIDPSTGRTAPQLPCRVRICDMGGCCDENHNCTAIVSTRHYRSPEVILGLGWMFSTDMWSMGCIIYELAVGRLLYDTHENHEHLHMLERTLGRLPAEWNAGRVREDCRAFFSTTTGQLRPISDPKSIARIQRTRPVRDVLQDELLRDLVLQCLQYDRQRRMTARQMAAHPYVVKYFPESLQSPLHPRNRQNMQPSPIA
jgi:serine/threonine protein kinase